MKAADRACQQKAFANVLSSVLPDTILPERVFTPSWTYFLFLESDRVFHRSFVTVMSKMLSIEAGSCWCLANLDQSDAMTFEKVAAAYFDRMVGEDEYVGALKQGEPPEWLYGIDRFCCTSDKGTWCIYCEKGEDIAILALRKRMDRARFSDQIRELWAEPIEARLAAKSPPPFNSMYPWWRDQLLKNYG